MDVDVTCQPKNTDTIGKRALNRVKKKSSVIIKRINA